MVSVELHGSGCSNSKLLVSSCEVVGCPLSCTTTARSSCRRRNLVSVERFASVADVAPGAGQAVFDDAWQEQEAAARA
jgi:hypothetical protein